MAEKIQKKSIFPNLSRHFKGIIALPQNYLEFL